MTPEEIKQIVHDTLAESGTIRQAEVKDVVREAVQETLLTLGVDAGSPLTVQQDMHFIRELRVASEQIKGRGMVVLVGLVVTALVAALWVGIRSALGAGG